MPVRMAAIKKSTNSKCWRGCREKGTLLHCWWEYKLVQPLWKTVWRFLAAAAAKSLQSCLILCDPIDGSPLASPVPGILQARALEWVAISFSSAGKSLGNCKWNCHTTQQTPVLGIHTEKSRIKRDTCAPMSIAELFTIAGTWEQPRSLSSDKWKRNLWYIYTMEYYSPIKKNTFESVLVRWMKLEPII